MNDDHESIPFTAGDAIALHIQRLRAAGQLGDDHPLLRIDPGGNAQPAHFVFDVAESVLHRPGCAAIPDTSHTALYAVQTIIPEDLRFACSRCKPEPHVAPHVETSTTTNLLYGMLALLDQFSSVLSERGREFRESERGRQVESTIESLLREVDEQQRNGLDMLLSTLDGFIHVAREFSNGQTPSARTNGAAYAESPDANAAPPAAKKTRNRKNNVRKTKTP